MNVKQFRSFVERNRPQLFLLSAVLFAIFALAACSLPTWIATANSILPIAGEMAAGVLALIAAFTGGPDAGAIATMNTVISAVSKALADIQAMVDEYNSTPTTSLLTEIQAGIQAVIDQVKQLMNDTGLTNTSLQNKVLAVLQLLLTEITAWSTMLPALAGKAGETFTLTIPLDSKGLKQAYNAILNTPTGDSSVDAAVAKLKRL